MSFPFVDRKHRIHGVPRKCHLTRRVTKMTLGKKNNIENL